ncbi:Spo0E family sporulation regulatory protein-aspartic acid phosphatase [Acetivibrio mesophilus]|jgi:hypothetical protein|uniref:Spo0E family sporulation regulatory protein-aspartic acid phosphatase n=1 Tax=Acetivibrio mesophilus TaxID=2487273 RepID=A0A4Q0I2R5_9FIRM|nr:Spo0E family sporulation regulatory protein-aspartic acid phosphatase [Acetivibrio mesophilus]RXE58007.1 Spo0E family sporulation regulatory protein-aspartic acid phosphatase [Acetivibrio mesophilus]
MSKELMYIIITKMHLRLNDLIEKNDFNLLNEKVLHYSQRLDKVLSLYDRVVQRDKSYAFSLSHLNKAAKCN